MSGGYIGTAPADRDPAVGNDTVSTSKIQDDAVSTAKVQDDAVTAAKLANSINTEIAANTAKVTNATHTGDVTGATALTIAADAVTTAKILDDNVTYAKMQDTSTANRVLGAATAGTIGEVQVTGDMIASTTITNSNINASAAIVGSKLSNPLNLEDGVLQRPEVKDYSETVNAIGGTGGGTQDIDISAGNVVTATVDTSTNTFTFSNPAATGKCGSFTLILTNGGSQTVNWPASVDWPGGTSPTLTTAGVDVLTFTTVDAGTRWYGFAAGLDMK